LCSQDAGNSIPSRLKPRYFYPKEVLVALYAELHRHLGGSVVPRILWRYLQRNDSDLAQRFPAYPEFEDFYTRPRSTLDEYLELHTLVESVQTAEALPYFIYRLMRGAYIFENLAYLELRYTPYLRTPEHLTQSQRIDLMAEIVSIVGKASRLNEYPIVTSQILCMHSRLPYEVNRAIVDLAAQSPDYVCAIDVAGGDNHYGERLEEFVELYAYARSLGLNTTGHLYETREGCHPELLPYLMRIGHGIQIPLQHPHLLKEVAERGQCLEVCPTTYLQTGTLEDISQLKLVFDRCFDAGVDIAICTDNAGLHNVRLPFEYESLLTHDIIGFEALQACQDAAFRHAFAWPYSQRPASLLTGLLSKGEPDKVASDREGASAYEVIQR
jgi:adenosine deaminase